MLRSFITCQIVYPLAVIYLMALNRTGMCWVSDIRVAPFV